MSESTTIRLPPGLGTATAAELLNYVGYLGRRGTLVNVWASWCDSCKQEMPLLVRLGKEYDARDLNLVFISVDRPEDAQLAVDQLKEHGVQLPSLLVRGELGPFKQAMSPQWKGSLPATFLFDADARLRYYWGAQAYEEELRPVLDGFLDGKNIDGAANFMVRQSGPER